MTLSTDFPHSRVVGVRLPDDERERLLRHAREQGQTVSSAVREALRIYLSDDFAHARRLFSQTTGDRNAA